MNKKKYYYLWIGQNATTGKPNQITGHYSNYGRIIKFESQKLRDEYIDEYRPNNPSEFIRPVNRKTARQYCLGDSVEQYLEYLDHDVLEYIKINGKWETK